MTFKVSPKKSLGQNFLNNPGIIEKIVAAAELTSNDKVLEVGPGTGTLTKVLVEKSGMVVAVEKDRRLIEDLEAAFSPAQVRIIEGDVLSFDPVVAGLRDNEYKIVANLPYYITSHFIRTVFEQWPQPILLVLMVQKEVAQRIMAPVRMAQPGGKPLHTNLLALSVQYYAEPRLVTHVSKGSFRPIPTVDSSVIKLIPRANLPLAAEQEERLFTIWKACFAGKRKQLINTLPSVLNLNKDSVSQLLTKPKISPQSRPETLSFEDWLTLINSL